MISIVEFETIYSLILTVKYAIQFPFFTQLMSQLIPIRLRYEWFKIQPFPFSNSVLCI